ncbi:unnamed protein product [Nezara viridula]|uniref:Uncharacterized protein n=1 Tax=Nezara viridula TaxID=85310 RepID=A0A9P0E5E6_NEZVI|nr:unnamed protein product [Nezara viridula]
MGTCSPCFSPRLRSLLAGIVQLFLSSGLAALHLLCLLKIINERQIYGPYFRYVSRRELPPPSSSNSYTGYHLFTLFMALVMFINTPILFCGMCREKADYICTWITINWVIIFIYVLILLYSLRIWILGFIIENALVLAVLINVVCCVNPLYDIMKFSKRNQEFLN